MIDFTLSWPVVNNSPKDIIFILFHFIYVNIETGIRNNSEQDENGED